MRRRLLYKSASLILACLVALIVWQGSFDFGEFGPSSPEQTYTVWAVSTLIFILTVTLGFMLVRNFVKLYVDRHSNREGSRIRTKLVIAALTLTTLPVIFHVLFSVFVLNRSLERWFSRPAESIKADLIQAGTAIYSVNYDRAVTFADWASTFPEVQRARSGDASVTGALQELCRRRGITELRVEPATGGIIWLCADETSSGPGVEARRGDLVVQTRLPLDLAQTKREIDEAVSVQARLAGERSAIWRSYAMLLALITLFILFVATWLALFLAKQISGPISALLGAAQEIRKGNLATRVDVKAIDELASLVRAFNEMTQDLESNSRELEKRRRFIEAILESIPTGVVSFSSDGRIQLVNRALKGLFSADLVEKATRLEDLLGPADAAEIRYLMNRARRLGVAASQFEYKLDGKTINLSATVAALEDTVRPGFVLVFEDTTDMLRAQKAAAWHEVARRVAHEIKNPLTPISLCAERISRHLERPPSPETGRILSECSAIISGEVETVRSLVDEFSHFARLPAAQPTPSDLNEVVETALAAFAGRLEKIHVTRDLAADLPRVNIDREQFKRLVVNLIDNAAEAMTGSLMKRLYVGTYAPTPDTVELTIADTGCGISDEDKEKLFLPYFTTKSRGTGLGLAIVNHIVVEHGAQIRVEDNTPIGARFIVELGVLPRIGRMPQPAEARA
jgi:PAS domain S-box-containing protein